MTLRIRLAVAVLLLLTTLPALAAAPAKTVGPYTVTVESVGRMVDYTQPPASQGCTVVNLLVAGTPDAMGRLVDTAQDPVALDSQGTKLVLQQIRFPERLPSVGPRPAKLQAQVWFSCPNPSADSLQRFTGSLVLYDRKDSYTLNFINVTSEKLGSQSAAGVTVAPEFLGPQDTPDGKVFRVRADVKLPARPAASPAAPQDFEKQWANEQLELIDGDGQPMTALATSRSYKYGDKNQIVGAVITASFALPPIPPRGLRYRVEQVQGLRTLPYRFDNLPLP